MAEHVVVLAGGTGGAKLARGMLDVVEPGRLTVIANTGDDIEIHGGYVSPDPDLVTFWLADRIDSRGWGLDGDTFHVMEGLRALGEDVWFNLGDRDLAIAIRRARELARGRRLSEVHADLVTALGVEAAVVPMSDRPVRTRVLATGRWWTLQEFLIRGARDGGWPPVEDVAFAGARHAGASPEAIAALAEADAIVIGPSNPIISIGPMLAVPELSAALRGAPAPCVAVSPLPAGQVVKGPTAEFMRFRGVPVTGEGIVELFSGLIDGFVGDAPVEGVPTLVTDLLMADAEHRRRLAHETLTFVRGLTRERPAGAQAVPFPRS